MTPRTRRLVTLLPLAALLWTDGLFPWPGILGYLELFKPSIIALTFALAAHKLGVASWPLVAVFSLTFFLYSIVMLYFIPGFRDPDIPGAYDNARTWLTYFAAMLLSPITLWGPLLFGCGGYAFALRVWPARRTEQLSI